MKTTKDKNIAIAQFLNHHMDSGQGNEEILRQVYLFMEYETMHTQNGYRNNWSTTYVMMDANITCRNFCSAN
jgi:hypothetical protein